jgi:DNA-binding transcriptional ArsR family regulator
MNNEEMDLIWKALSDPSRRELLDLLRDSPKTTGELCEQFKEMTRFGVMKHLKVLESARLITIKWEGRERWNYINAAPLQKVFERWITPYQSLWASSLNKLKTKIESEDGNDGRNESHANSTGSLNQSKKRKGV